MLMQIASAVAPCYTIEKQHSSGNIKMATTSIRLDQQLIEKATIMAKALDRTPP